MVLQKLFPKKAGAITDEDVEDYMEVNVADSAASTRSLGKIGIRVEKLNDFSDIDRVLKVVREGSIIFLRIKGLKEKDIGELKRAVERLKKTVLAQNGDIVGIEQDWLILTPDYAVVHR